MKKSVRIIALIMTFIMAFCLAACSKIPEKEPVTETTTAETTTKADKSKYTLYIGNDASGYKEYDSKIKDDELTPEKLIQAISDLTGWNMTLADEVTTGKGGMTVSFSDESFIKVGPPEKQKSEFFMFDNYSLLTTALDSIKKTLQMNYVTEDGDPDKLDIYFNIENKSIVVEDVRVPMDKPWNSEMMKK